MFYDRVITRYAANRVADAIESVVTDLREGHIKEEPDFTGRMIGAIVERMRGYKVRGAEWNANSVSSHGPGSLERFSGADFIGILEFNAQGYSVRKGFLAQAKLLLPNSNLDIKALLNQCSHMLDLSPDSFVFLYTPNGVKIVPAISVIGATGNVYDLIYRYPQRFFQDHFESFIGDRVLYLPTEKALKDFLREYSIEYALYLEAKVKGES